MQEMSVLYSVLWDFILYSMTGWLAEVIYCSVNTGQFVNRGFLNGPVCPIYGFGAIIISKLLIPFSDSTLVLYVGSVLICSVLEFVSGFLLKHIFHTSWWDYTGEPFCVGGYICLKFSLLWGFAGFIFVKGLQPLFSGLVSMIPYVLGAVLLAIFYAVFLTDLAVTILSIFKLNQDLAHIDKLVHKLRSSSDIIARGVGSAAIHVAEQIEDLELDNKKEVIADKIDATRSKLTQSVSITRDHLVKKQTSLIEQLKAANKSDEAMPLIDRLQREAEKRHGIHKRLIRAFPKMKNMRYNDTFKKYVTHLMKNTPSEEDENNTANM